MVPGRTNNANAIKISYDFDVYAWVSIWRAIDPTVLSGTTGISFFYKGSGALNTIEFKLRLRDRSFNAGGEDIYFYTSKYIETDTGGNWTPIKVLYTSFECEHPTEGCKAINGVLDLARVVKIDFAIVNKPDLGNRVGSGSVIIDEISGVKP